MKLMQILWKMCWMLSILILVLKELRESLKLMKIFISPNTARGSSKATPLGDIPADILKSTVDIHLPF